MINFDFASLRLIGLTPAIANQLHALAADNDDDASLQMARITEIHRDNLVVHNGSQSMQVRALPRLLSELAADDSSLAVGDWGLLSNSGDIGADYRFIASMPPFTHLARRNNEGRLQALASNVDTALLVMGLDSDFKLRRLERYLALVQAAGVAPVIVLTKADVHEDAQARLAEVEQRLSASVPVLAVNGQSSTTADLLAPWMVAGQTLILLGSSGAGKSTLTNTLASSAQDTGAVRTTDGRGQHTTTARSLHLCPGGACIIDTPGLRTLQLNLDEQELSASFADIDALAAECQFRDCSHQSEPGCAVRDSVDADRLSNFQKLQRETRRHQQTPLERIAARSKWKVLMRSVKEKDRMKRS
ncbi:ribosome small subunit-dependent GTPase A [Undibacterium sp. TC9W]|uniref:ribosome small subunit-dependent GTPase A n=1 Tax=Undibacterium sp. TC9W TaxID=3413053 RepID=UPI003BF1C957